MKITKLYKNGKKRALTFSFDDGYPQDLRVIYSLNKYGMHGTFNLCSQRCSSPAFAKDATKGITQLWEPSEAFRAAYNCHEIASHTLTHLNLTELKTEEKRRQIVEDIKALSTLAGYTVHGFVSPFNQFDGEVIEIARSAGARHHRTGGRDVSFIPPKDFMHWTPTAHVCDLYDNDGKKLINDFFESQEELAVMMIWGHSYEHNVYNNWATPNWTGCEHRWDFFEKELIPTLGGRDDIWYATCLEICDYNQAMKKAVIENNRIENQSDIPLWFCADGKTVVLGAKQAINLK